MKRLFLGVTFCSGLVWASPQNGIVLSGEVDIDQSSLGTTITQQSQQAWIDWEAFNIGVDEWVNINQLIENGLTVNRVTGDDASAVFGQLQSNGTVYLVNPNGVLFSETSRVDVGRLFVSDHWLSTDGTLTTSEKNSSGIELLGQIETREDFTALAERIHNGGVISADNVNLLGSQGALLHLDDQGLVSVLVPASIDNESWVKNTGAIVAQGQIYLGSPEKNDWLNTLAANNRVDVSGELTAQSIDIDGSEVELLDASLTAQLIDIESQSTTYIGSSTLTAVDEKIRIRGEEIQVHSETEMNVGSGELSIGGLYQGQGNDHNANFVHVSSSVHLYGNGGTQGNGGDIILWSDGTTSFHGTIDAKGGTQSGDGGFVEVSGKDILVFRGDVNTSVTKGEMGTLLLDPTVITIANGTGGANDGQVTGDGVVLPGDVSGSPITISEQALEGISAATNISLEATEAIVINDLVDDALTLDQTGSVSFTVQNTAGEGRFTMLDINDTIEMTGGGNLSINVSGNVFESSATNSVSIDIGNIAFTNGGNLIIGGSNSQPTLSSSVIDVSVRDISITDNGNVNLSALNLSNTDVGDVTIDVGNVSISGTGSNQVDITIDSDNGVAAVLGASTLNLNGDINVSGDGTAGHYVNFNVKEDTVTGGIINSAGDIIVPAGDITLSTGIVNFTDATPSLDTFNGTELGVLAFTATGIDAGGNALTFAGNNAELIDFSLISNIGALSLTTQNSFTFGNAGAISAAELTALSGISSLTLSSFGDITADTAVTDFDVNLNADYENNGTGSVVLNGLNSTNNNLSVSGADVSGSGAATNVGTGTVTFHTNGNGQSISVSGSETYNIEAGVWNNIATTSGVTIEGVSGGNQIYFEHGTLGFDVSLDGSGGAGVVIDGAAKNYGGANLLNLVGSAYILTDVSMTNDASSLAIDGALTIGETGGINVAVQGNWDTTGITSINLAGDVGDSATLTHIHSSSLSLPTITSANDVHLVVNGIRGITMAGADIGNLSVNLDTNDNGGNAFNATGNYSINNLLVNGTLGIGSVRNETAVMAGAWTIGGSVDFTNLDDVTFTNDSFSFIADGNLTLESGTTLTLGTSLTAFDLVSTNGNLLFDDLITNRPINISASGSVTGGYLDAATRTVSITSDSDTAGDESILLTDIRAGDLTLNGDFVWDFNPTLSGDYVQSSGDVQVSDATISAFSIDTTSADSVSLSGTLNTFEARSGAVNGNAWLDSGANANLTVTATTDINLVSLDTNSGNVNLTADSDTNGSGGTALSTATGGALTITNDATLAGNVDFTTIVSSGDTTLNNANLFANAIDTTAWGNISLAGTTNSVTANAGSISFTNANDAGTNANLTLTATGLVNIDSVDTGTGDLTIVSDSDTTGGETISINASSGEILTLNSNAALTGSNDFASVISTNAISFSDATLSVDSFDSTGFASTSFTGTQNTLNVENGVLVLDTPTIASGSNLLLNVGAGAHRLNNIDVVLGDINIGAVSGSVNQQVTAEGAWAFSDLTVSNIDTFINNAQLTAAGVVAIQVTDDIVLNEGSRISANEVLLDAGDDVTVTGISASSEQLPSVTIRADGDLFDGGNTDFDIDVFWLDGVEYDIVGSQEALDVNFQFGGDFGDTGSELAAISDDSLLTIQDDSESGNPLDGENASVGSLPKNRVDVFVPECSGNNKNCRKKNAIRKFLSALMIGGAIPE